MTCPAFLSRRLAAGLCNSTANQATIAPLRADLIAQGATDVTIYCVDTAIAGRRLLATTQAVYTASVCSPEKSLPLPLGQKTGEVVDGCVPVVSATAAPRAEAPRLPA